MDVLELGVNEILCMPSSNLQMFSPRCLRTSQDVLHLRTLANWCESTLNLLSVSLGFLLQIFTSITSIIKIGGCQSSGCR